MKYFVSDKFRLYKIKTATKGPACREKVLWNFDFFLSKNATKGPAWRQRLKASVVMKYFVSYKFRLYKIKTATKGPACREKVLWNFDFFLSKNATKGPSWRQRLKAQHAVRRDCKFLTFFFLKTQQKVAVNRYCDISTYVASSLV